MKKIDIISFYNFLIILLIKSNFIFFLKLEIMIFYLTKFYDFKLDKIFIISVIQLKNIVVEARLAILM